MPFPYEFPFKFEEFTRILKLILKQSEELEITSTHEHYRKMIPSVGKVLNIQSNPSSHYALSSNATREFNFYPSYKGGG